MQLTNLVLKNFRTHKNATFDFAEGVTAIIGGNGTGKSSIVEAIIFLLTGEGYGKTKAEMLTVGQTSGWVIGRLNIDGKEAVLERHIDTAKVNFTYDGKTYKKSGEVNEIWDQLFQIDKNIVQNVIVSNQGEIALLFNGDNATKEKLFQKIFMVPNTTKVRDIIWNNYIKDAPPEYPVKDVVQITSDIQCLEKLVELSTIELNELPKTYDAEYAALVTRQAFLRSVEQSADEHLKLTTDMTTASDNLAKVDADIETLKSKMQLINIQDYRDCLAAQRAAYSFHASKQQLLVKKQELRRPLMQPELSDIDIKLLQQSVANLEADLKVKREAVAELNRKIQEYEKSGLGTGVCPTCGTNVDNVVKLIEHLDAERAAIIKAGQEEKSTLQRTKGFLEKNLEVAERWESYTKELDAIENALSAYKDVNFDQEAYDLCESVVNKYAGWETKLTGLDQERARAAAVVNDKQLALAALVKYDKDPVEFRTEQIVTQEKLTKLNNAREDAKKLEIEIAANEREIKTLKQDLADNNTYVEKNNKRKEYVSVLKNVYDLFHTGKFPRALIQTYSSTVTEYMNEVLASFDFPYTAKVNETFGIDIFNEEGLQLPAISGGQQVMVGFSLRLALHNMFVGAFPFMIVDEGSYGLNNDNAKKYFEIIKTLGKSSKFKQVIVIDHHSELEEYVDNTINL
jgi:DNA repair exonuclease SbcCD ATPase subunit